MLNGRAWLRLLAALAIAGVAWAAAPARACTTFCLSDGGKVVYGKNYDFGIGDGMVVVNKRGVAKVALLESEPAQNAARWTSKYGSVTFNQFGRELPNGGMNEAGLVVEVMWLDEARYPAPDARPAVGVLAWVQHQLDSFATVAEVRAHAPRLRIDSEIPLHYLVCDASGDCTSVEFLDGALVHHPTRALTNHTYAASRDYLAQRGGAAAEPPKGKRVGSLDRFVTASRMVHAWGERPSGSRVDYAFGVLERTSHPTATQWSIVYDVTGRQVHFRTRGQRQVRRVDLARLDFGCASPVKTLDLRARLEGDVTARFGDYTYEANRALIRGAYRRVPFLAHIAPALLEQVARHPDGATCAPPAP
jgi:penicillin V acylase-like amidase (Ntn superfamily)